LVIHQEAAVLVVEGAARGRIFFLESNTGYKVGLSKWVGRHLANGTLKLLKIVSEWLSDLFDKLIDTIAYNHEQYEE
jgi:hypothetical protein